MEPGLKARMSPDLKGREMTLGLFCSHSFSEKEVLISAHLRHNSLAQMKAKKQTHNCCGWEQRSQEEHVRSFPCEQCTPAVMVLSETGATPHPGLPQGFLLPLPKQAPGAEDGSMVAAWERR